MKVVVGKREEVSSDLGLIGYRSINFSSLTAFNTQQVLWQTVSVTCCSAQRKFTFLENT